MVDPVAEKQRLARELEAIGKHIAGTEARLANPAFTGKGAPGRSRSAQSSARRAAGQARAELERLAAALK